MTTRLKKKSSSFLAQIAISRASTNRFFSTRKNQQDGRALVNRCQQAIQMNGAMRAVPLLFSNEIVFSKFKRKLFILDHRADLFKDETLMIANIRADKCTGNFRLAKLVRSSKVSYTRFCLGISHN